MYIYVCNNGKPVFKRVVTDGTGIRECEVVMEEVI